MAWPVDMSLTSGGTSSLPKEKSLPEFDASDALEIVFSKAAACLSSMMRVDGWEHLGAPEPSVSAPVLRSLGNSRALSRQIPRLLRGGMKNEFHVASGTAIHILCFA